MIGLGTQDDLGEAEKFVDDHGTDSFTMLWDSSYLSWQLLGVTSSPTSVLFDADGTPLAGWVGEFPEDDILRLAAAAR